MTLPGRSHDTAAEVSESDTGSDMSDVDSDDESVPASASVHLDQFSAFGVESPGHTRPSSSNCSLGSTVITPHPRGLEHTTAETPPKTSFVPDRDRKQQLLLLELQELELLLQLKAKRQKQQQEQEKSRQHQAVQQVARPKPRPLPINPDNMETQLEDTSGPSLNPGCFDLAAPSQKELVSEGNGAPPVTHTKGHEGEAEHSANDQGQCHHGSLSEDDGIAPGGKEIPGCSSDGYSPDVGADSDVEVEVEPVETDGPAKVCIELDTDSEESSLDQTVHYSQADFSGSQPKASSTRR